MQELEKLGSLLDISKEAYGLGSAIISQHLVGRSTETDLKIVAYLIFTKGFRTFQSAQNLCRCGLGSDAVALCASLFENYVDLRFIEKAPMRRSRRYMQYEQVEKYYQAQKILSRKRLPKGWRKQYQGYECSLKPQVKALLRHFPSKSKGWSQKSLSYRARQVKAGLEYDSLYWIFCGYKHTLPMVASGLVLEHEDGVDLVYGASMKGVYHAARHSTEYFLKLCDLFGYVYNLGIKSDVKTIFDKLTKVADNILQTHPNLCE
jgi:hypothetical protein